MLLEKARVIRLLLICVFISMSSACHTSESARSKLQAKGIEYNEQAFWQKTAEGDVSAVTLFLHAGMQQNKAALEKAAAIAVEDRKPSVLRELLAHGADANAAVNSSGETLLMDAASRAEGEAVHELIAHGANVNAKDGRGDTPLLDELDGPPDGNRLQVARDLIAQGADVNARDTSGRSPSVLAGQWAGDCQRWKTDNTEQKCLALVDELRRAGAKK